MSTKELDLTTGQVLNGRVDYKTGACSHLDGYTQVILHPGKKYEYGHLSPYTLTNNKGQNVENVWQFSKIYETVTSQNQWGYVVGQQGKVQIWSHPSETHIVDDSPTKAYWRWRRKGLANPHAVRYPNGFQGRHKVVASLVKTADGTYSPLGYVESRKLVYNKEMIDSIVNSTDSNVIQEFRTLKKLYKRGEKLIFAEVDGPTFHDSFPYDKVQRGTLGDDGVDLLPTEKEFIRGCLENTNRPFGHGYVLASLVIGKEKWLS